MTYHQALGAKCASSELTVWKIARRSMVVSTAAAAIRARWVASNKRSHSIRTRPCTEPLKHCDLSSVAVHPIRK